MLRAKVILFRMKTKQKGNEENMDRCQFSMWCVLCTWYTWTGRRENPLKSMRFIFFKMPRVLILAATRCAKQQTNKWMVHFLNYGESILGKKNCFSILMLMFWSFLYLLAGYILVWKRLDHHERNVIRLTNKTRKIMVYFLVICCPYARWSMYVM